MSTQSLGYDLSLIDLHDTDFLHRTGAYVFHEKEIAILETCASPSIPYLIAGLNKLGIRLSEVRYIIVTHIHLDHSGGAGLLMKQCPNATLLVHPKGARHLSEPDRLIESAKMVYGTDFDRLFDPIVPVPKERIREIADGETIYVGSRPLHFLHTDGHANHHVSIWDEKSAGMFTGDVMGVRYWQLEQEGIPLYLPVTSPNQFNPDAMKESMARMMAFKPERVYFGHYGVSEHPKKAEEEVTAFMDRYVEEAKQAQSVEELYDRLLAIVQEALDARGVTRDHPVYDMLAIDLEISAQGLMHYKKKHLTI